MQKRYNGHTWRLAKVGYDPHDMHETAHQIALKMNASQDTVTKQRSLSNLRPFTKGDPRINRKGRPKSFDQFRELAQAIAQEMITDNDGNPMTVADAILRSWAESKQPLLQKAFIEYAFRARARKSRDDRARKQNDAHFTLCPRATGTRPSTFRVKCFGYLPPFHSAQIVVF